MPQIAYLTKEILLIVTFAVASYYDIKSRDIPPTIWVPLFAVNTPLTIIDIFSKPLSLLDLISIAIDILMTIVYVLMCIAKLIGGADVIAILAIIATFPTPRVLVVLLTGHVVLPPILSIITYYVIVLLLFVGINVARNTMSLGLWRKLRIPLFKLIVYMMIARITTVGEYISNSKYKFFYPLYVPGMIERLGFDVYEDRDQWIEKLCQLDRSTPIVVSWGIPMIAVLFIALTTYILVGDLIQLPIR